VRDWLGDPCARFIRANLSAHCENAGGLAYVRNDATVGTSRDRRSKHHADTRSVATDTSDPLVAARSQFSSYCCARFLRALRWQESTGRVQILREWVVSSRRRCLPPGSPVGPAGKSHSVASTPVSCSIGGQPVSARTLRQRAGVHVPARTSACCGGGPEYTADASTTNRSQRNR
jgi:hypothetical protein